MDIIRIEQLEIFAYHGCNEEENERWSEILCRC